MTPNATASPLQPSAAFLRAFELVIGSEGGYVNDPRDPGGETKYGISKRAYPNLDIANLQLADAQTIYYRDYWCRLNLDSRPWDIALSVFDSAVNMGDGEAEHLLPEALRWPNPATELLAQRALLYTTRPGFPTYGLGWLRRITSMAYQAGKGSGTPIPPSITQ